MELQNINITPELRRILKDFDIALGKREEFELGFSIFSLVSDTYYKENFHSEIIHALLNTEGKHKEESIFLDCFLYFLKDTFIDLEIDLSNYKTDIEVFNEHPIEGRRRIDILIRSKTHAIIIENKINNAIDMDNQLPDYYNYCKKKNLKVDAILYLSLDGNKTPDYTKWTCNLETKKEIGIGV